MEGSAFEEEGFFRAIGQSGARVLLIGRRAMVVLGAPVLTADYDLWIHPDDIERLNAAVAPFELNRRLAAALADEEQMAANQELCRWFLRRYPTAAHLDDVRRKYQELTVPMESAPDIAPSAK